VRDTKPAQVAPRTDEVEVTLLGPGYGESIVVHAGEGCWIIVDSCVSDTGTPQPLDYLIDMGIDAAEAVALIVATHWHDDHIRGMSELVNSCRKAKFHCAAALRRKEFLAAIHALNGRGSFAGNSGIHEIHEVFTHLKKQGRQPRFALSDRRLFTTSRCEI